MIVPIYVLGDPAVGVYVCVCVYAVFPHFLYYYEK